MGTRVISCSEGRRNSISIKKGNDINNNKPHKKMEKNFRLALAFELISQYPNSPKFYEPSSLDELPKYFLLAIYFVT